MDTPPPQNVIVLTEADFHVLQRHVYHASHHGALLGAFTGIAVYLIAETVAVGLRSYLASRRAKAA